MNVKSILIGSIIIGILSLSGCVTTPYYGGLGYYRNTAHGYGHQSPIYINPGYIGAHKGLVGKLKRAEKDRKPTTTHQEGAELTENRISGSLFCRKFALFGRWRADLSYV